MASAPAVDDDEIAGEEEALEEEEEEMEGEDDEDMEDDDDETDAPPPDVRPWASLKAMPAATQTALMETLKRLRAANRSELTALVVGKNGVGKSSLVNTVFGDRVVPTPVSSLEPDPTRQFSRTAADFTLSVVNTPGLLQGDGVSDRALTEVSKRISGKAVDVVLYVERLDVYRTDDNDRAVLGALHALLGPSVWERTVLVLTHGSASSLPLPAENGAASNGNGAAAAGAGYRAFVKAKVAQVEATLKKATGSSNAKFATSTVVECSTRNRKNASGEGVLPDDTPYLSRLVDAMADVALKAGAPLVHAHGARRIGRKGGMWRKLLIPVLCYAQWFLYKHYIKRFFEEDECKGDRYSDFSTKERAAKQQALDDARQLSATRTRRAKDDERARAAVESSVKNAAPGASDEERAAALAKKKAEKKAAKKAAKAAAAAAEQEAGAAEASAAGAPAAAPAPAAPTDPAPPATADAAPAPAPPAVSA